MIQQKLFKNFILQWQVTQKIIKLNTQNIRLYFKKLYLRLIRYMLKCNSVIAKSWYYLYIPTYYTYSIDLESEERINIIHFYYRF